MPSLKKFWYASLAFAVGVNGQASPAAATTGTTFSQTYDFIVVGSGAGGSMVANRLVRMGQTVLVLEAGPTDFSQSTNFDLQNWFLLSQEEVWFLVSAFNTKKYKILMFFFSFLSFQPNAYRWNDTTQPEPGLGGRTIAMSTMRSLGGGTTFNAGTWVRGSVFDWNAIATAAQDSSWNYNNIMPLFNEIEVRMHRYDAFEVV
jgi:choline dehydrogenase-like flavoprotein